MKFHFTNQAGTGAHCGRGLKHTAHYPDVDCELCRDKIIKTARLQGITVGVLIGRLNLSRQGSVPAAVKPEDSNEHKQKMFAKAYFDLIEYAPPTPERCELCRHRVNDHAHERPCTKFLYCGRVKVTNVEVHPAGSCHHFAEGTPDEQG